MQRDFQQPGCIRKKADFVLYTIGAWLNLREGELSMLIPFVRRLPKIAKMHAQS